MAEPLQLTCADLAQTTGRDLGATDWFEVAQDRVDVFADATDDHQWIHVDPERAAAGPFGGTIAHGYLTLALVPALLKQLYVVTDQVRGTNYGLERVRFTAPVPVGAKVRLAATVASAETRSDDGVKVELDVTVELQDAERPAMVGRVLLLSYAS